MNLGKQIREHRQRLSLTQEKLAEQLNVTPQAVSKWENSSSLPDITLLPALSSALGVQMEELFDDSEEQHLNRIETMMEKSLLLSDDDYRYALSFLQKRRETPRLRSRCLSLLAELYLHQSQGYASLAEETAQRALEENPEDRSSHLVLFKTSPVGPADWCYANHNERIRYYQRFVDDHPGYLPGYLWLMDYLIADQRLTEADHVLHRMQSVEKTYHTPLYQGLIAFAAGHHDEAESCWKHLTEDFPAEWKAWFVRADLYARHAMYHEAIALLRETVTRQPAPRYTDFLHELFQYIINLFYIFSPLRCKLLLP